LPRARRRWRADAHGRLEPFSLASHLRLSGAPILRHLAACAVALLLGPALVRLAERCLRDGAPLRRAPRRLLYLRAQFWFGLQGGGSVAHTAGVIRGLQQAGAEVRVVASDDLRGFEAPTQVL